MIYTDGTIAIKAGSPVVTGTGTQWKKNIHGVAPGQLISIDNGTAPVSMMIRAVNSDTELVLSFNAPVTLSGAKYSIATTVPDTISDAARTMSANQGYIVYFLQAMQQWMTDTGQVEIELPNGQKVTLDSIKALSEAISKIPKVVQETGESKTDVMSQKAVKDWVNNSTILTNFRPKQGGDLSGVGAIYAQQFMGVRESTVDSGSGSVVQFEARKGVNNPVISVAKIMSNGAANWKYYSFDGDWGGTLAVKEWVSDYGIGSTLRTWTNPQLDSRGSGAFRQGGGDASHGNDNYFSGWGCGFNLQYDPATWARFFVNCGTGNVIFMVNNNGNRRWNDLWGTLNTVVDGNGFIKRSSPIIQIHSDGSYDTNDESEGVEVRRTGTGQYHITGILGYNSDGAWGVNGGISVPKDNNGLELVYVDDRVLEDGSIIIETCHRQHAHLPERFQNWRLKEVTPEGERIFYQDGEPCDLPESTRLDVRVEMPQGSVWNVKQRELAEQMEREQTEREAQEAAGQAVDSEK